MKTINNLTISSWNIQGLGDKHRDDFFMSKIKYDINILIETWKGNDSTIDFPDFKTLQKFRRKKKRSRRFSGGIIILYKSKYHKGISVLDITESENRLWIKLDKTFFGFKTDLFICACYIPPVTSPYYDEDFVKLEQEISKIPNKDNILIIGDLNARISNTSDYIEDEADIHSSIQNILPENYNPDFNIKRNSMDKILNIQGQNLIDLCIASRLRVLNGRFVGDLFGNFTCH